jgi:hypothetical protein
VGFIKGQNQNWLRVSNIEGRRGRKNLSPGLGTIDEIKMGVHQIFTGRFFQF